MDLVNIKLRKIAVDVLDWNHEEARFVLEGKLLFTQPTDNNWRKGRTIKLTPVNALLVINGKVNTSVKMNCFHTIWTQLIIWSFINDSEILHVLKIFI